MFKSRSKRSRRNHLLATCLSRKPCPSQMAIITAPPMVNEMPPATAAPATPICGNPKCPKTKTYRSGMLITLTAPPIHRGDQASPAARNAAPRMKFTAKARLNKDIQRMFDAASSVVSASRPKIDATGPAARMPGTVTASANAPPATRLAMVIRLASSRSSAPQARATSAVVPALTAISTACRAKNTRCPTPMAASASGPRVPTNFSWTMATAEYRRLARIDGKASENRLGGSFEGCSATMPCL